MIITKESSSFGTQMENLGVTGQTKDGEVRWRMETVLPKWKQTLPFD